MLAESRRWLETKAPSPSLLVEPPEDETFFSMGNTLYWSCVYSTVALMVWALHKYSSDCEQADADESDVPENLWALNLIAAIRQAKYGRFYVNAKVVTALSVFMGCLQLFVLFLVVHDIDPNADPVTSKPSSPWVKSTWSVNCMKWVMVTFLGVFMVREAGDVRMLLEAIIMTHSERLSTSKTLLYFTSAFQYLILIMIIWGGVTAVLSFQAVPDILYSSMSITFIAKVDEAFFTMVSQVFDIKAEFTIIHREKADIGSSPRLCPSPRSEAGAGSSPRREQRPEGGQPQPHDFADPSGALPSGAEAKLAETETGGQPISPIASALLRFMVILPVVLAVALNIRAFYTNVMPSQRLHASMEWAEHAMR